MLSTKESCGQSKFSIRALTVCKSNSRKTYQLYAVDSAVVFKNVGLEAKDLLLVAITD
jgi:hypothetical protein